MEQYIIKSCSLYDSTEPVLSDIIISGRKIEAVVPSSDNNNSGHIIDAGGRIAAPGFIDIHIQGAGGADILDNSLKSLETISSTLARTGTTSYLGTTVVKPAQDNAHLRLASQYVNKSMDGATLLGFHLEGPFINVKKKGGLDPLSIYEPSAEAAEEILRVTAGTLKMMTIAPELPGAHDIIRLLKSNNVVPAFAHSDADYQQTIAGFEAGIDHITHIFNAMAPLTHRAPGPIGAILENETITAQIISDGHHLHPSVVRLLFTVLGPERCICITDGMHGIGLPEGNYFYNGKEYTSKAGAARYLDGTLIGSTMSLANIALKFREFTGCSLKQAFDTVTINPARVIGIDNAKGSLAPGKDADIVVFNEDFSVNTTLVEGRMVYRSESN